MRNCIYLALGVSIFLLAELFEPNEGYPRRAIPDDNLAYPVLTIVKGEPNSIGSGFYLRIDKEIYFVTARHVLIKLPTGEFYGSEAILSSYSKNPDETEKTKMVLDLESLNKEGHLQIHNDKDIAVIHVGSITRSENGLDEPFVPIPGVTLKETVQSGFVVVHSSAITTFDDVLISNDVYVFGYPVSLGLKGHPQFDYQRPLLRKGIVAGKYLKARSLILDIPAYGGNSGGPVLQVEEAFPEIRYRVVGVIIEFIPLEEKVGDSNHLSNSGYAVATPMEFVLDLVGKLGKKKDVN